MHSKSRYNRGIIKLGEIIRLNIFLAIAKETNAKLVTALAREVALSVPLTAAAKAAATNEQRTPSLKKVNVK